MKQRSDSRKFIFLAPLQGIPFHPSQILVMKKGLSKLTPRKDKKLSAQAVEGENHQKIAPLHPVESAHEEIVVSNGENAMSINPSYEAGKLFPWRFNSGTENAVSLSNVQENFMLAIQKLKTGCANFTEYNKDFLVANDFQSLINRAQQEPNIHLSAELFRSEISEVIRIKCEGDQVSKKKVLHRVGHFLAQLFPVARFSLSMTGTVAEVLPPSPLLIVGSWIRTCQVRGQRTWYHSTGKNYLKCHC
jgi:hypothetical protein